MSQFAKRRIDVTINLGEGQFGEDKGQDVLLTGLRVSAVIDYPGGGVQASAQIRIFGLPLEMINKLTRIGVLGAAVRLNSIIIAAGSEDGPMSTVYWGTIYTAFADFNGSPNVALNVIAFGSYFDAIRPVEASSFIGTVNVVDVMRGLAKLMQPQPQGLTLEPNGVSVMLSNPYYHGTAYQQIKECAKEAGIEFSIDRGVLSLWNRNEHRKAADGPIKVSKETGMVGYPTYNSQGIILTTLFNPDMAIGKQAEVSSESTPANGVWTIFSCVHDLESETPGGRWFTQSDCVRGDTQ